MDNVLLRVTKSRQLRLMQPVCVRESCREIETNEHSCTQKKHIAVKIKQHDMMKRVQFTLKNSMTKFKIDFTQEFKQVVNIK